MTTLNYPMSRMIEAALQGNLDDNWKTSNSHQRMTPRADIMEGPNEFLIVMDLPGIKAEDLDIQVENQTLGITAKRSHQIPEGFDSRRRERMGEVTFSRNFNLGTVIDQDNIGARLEEGILLLTLPKSETGMPRRIEVK